MGYLLTDNTIGVLFNDRSSLIRLYSDMVIWIERVRLAGKETALLFHNSTIPFDLQYKFQIFKEFEAQLLPYIKSPKEQAIVDYERQTVFYLYKWQRKPSCVLFQMSKVRLKCNSGLAKELENWPELGLARNDKQPRASQLQGQDPALD